MMVKLILFAILGTTAIVEVIALVTLIEWVREDHRKDLLGHRDIFRIVTTCFIILCCIAYSILGLVCIAYSVLGLTHIIPTL